MKVSLVVASGAHEGRVIPLTGPQFLIGRDQQCHLRPASQAISKLHCAVTVRDGKVYVQDFGSTNGTLVNEELIQNVEVGIENGASLRVGPLDFRVRIEVLPPPRDGTPLPGNSPETAAALAAVKAATAKAAKAVPTSRDNTPNPAKTATEPRPAARLEAPKSGVVPHPTKPGGSKEAPALKPGTNEAPAITSSESVPQEDHDRIAAMLLGMDDDGNGTVPDGSTVMDIPNPLTNNPAGPGDPASKAGEPKKDDKAKVAQTREEMSTAANDLLRKYMRRPK
jgi:predicted component of type VI protein secretion system